MDVLKELTGIDIMDMQNKQAKGKDEEEDMEKKMAQDIKRSEQEEERRQKKQAEDALSQEEKSKIAIKKAAEAKKAEGNDAYKQKKFE